MRKQFVKTLKNILYSDEKAVLLLGDIGVFGFREELKTLPTRTYNIGILEQSTISMAAGMAKGGLTPFVHTIAPFMVERAFEQLKLDFGYQNLNGNFVSVGSSYDYAGLGCTHHCPGDVSVLLAVPNMEIIVPGTSQEFDTLVTATYNNGNPTYTRISEYQHKQNFSVEFGKGNAIRTGKLATIICFGPMLEQVLEATRGMDVTVLYYSTVYPFDEKLLLDNYNETIILCEPFYEGTTNHLVSSALRGKKYSLTNIGIPRKFLTNYGKKSEHDRHLKLDAQGIEERITQCLI